MILVLVGTNPYSFDRLVRAVDEYAFENEEPFFIQLGHTNYIPKNASHARFLDKEEILQKIRESSLVITQGGFGSIADCLREGKKVVAVPRKPELNEAPDRQEELVRELERLGKLVGVYEIDQLGDAIIKARGLNTDNRSNQSISALINNFIKES